MRIRFRDKKTRQVLVFTTSYPDGRVEIIWAPLGQGDSVHVKTVYTEVKK